MQHRQNAIVFIADSAFIISAKGCFHSYFWLLSLTGKHERQVLALRPGGGRAPDQFAHAQLGEAEFTWMRTLKPSTRLGDEILLCHGSPRSDHEHLLETLDGNTLHAATPGGIAVQGPQAA